MKNGMFAVLRKVDVECRAYGEMLIFPSKIYKDRDIYLLAVLPGRLSEEPYTLNCSRRLLACPISIP